MDRESKSTVMARRIVLSRGRRLTPGAKAADVPSVTLVTAFGGEMGSGARDVALRQCPPCVGDLLATQLCDIPCA